MPFNKTCYVWFIGTFLVLSLCSFALFLHAYGRLLRTAALLTLLSGAVGNFVVTLAIFGDAKMRRSLMYILLANLALADNVLLSTVVSTYYGYNAKLHSHLADAIFYAVSVAIGNSVYTSVAVCIERYVAVAYPLHVGRLFRPKRVLLFVVHTWSSTALWYVPIQFGYHWCDSSDGSRACEVLTTLILLQQKLDLLLFNVLPFVVLPVLYAKMFVILWLRDAPIRDGENFRPVLDRVKLSWQPPPDEGGVSVSHYDAERKDPQTGLWAKVNTTPITSTNYVDHIIQPGHSSYEYRISAVKKSAGGEPSDPSKQVYLKPVSAVARTRKTTDNGLAVRRSVVSMLAVCVVAFYSCYAVYSIWKLRRVLNGTWTIDQSAVVGIVLVVVGSSVNPFVYTIFSKQFRERVWAMLPSCSCFSGCVSK